MVVPALHLVAKQHAGLPRLIGKYVNAADAIAVEFDTSNSELMAELAGCRKIAGSREKGAGVSLQIGQKFQAAAASRGLLNVAPANGYAALADQISFLSLHAEADSLSVGVDASAIEAANGLNKKVVSLERPCDQIEAGSLAGRFWNEVTIAEKFKQLDVNEPAVTVKRLSDAWASGNFDEMENIWSEFNRRWPTEALALNEMMRLRNPRLVQEIVGMTRQKNRTGPPVVFIGAFHFMGVEGVFKKLTDLGFAVVRVDFGG